MTSIPDPRVQDLPTLRRDLESLEGLTRSITLKLERLDTLGLDVLESLTQTLHRIFETLEELLPGLNALSLERHNQDDEAELEATFLEFKRLRGAVMAALGVLGSQAVSELEGGPGLFSALDHAPVTSEPVRFEGDWVLPSGATLRAVLFVELPELEAENPRQGHASRVGITSAWLTRCAATRLYCSGWRPAFVTPGVRRPPPQYPVPPPAPGSRTPGVHDADPV